MRLAQAGEPPDLGFRQGFHVASYRLREQQRRKLGQYGLRSRTAGGDLCRRILERRTYPFGGSSLLDIELEKGRKRRDQGVAFGAAATEEAAYHLRALARSAMMNREKPAIFARPDDFDSRDRRNTEIASHQVQVVARQQNHLAGLDDCIVSALTFNADAKLALDDIVINDQVRRRPESRRTMLGRHACRYAP